MTEETDDTEFLGQLFEIANSRVRPDLLRAEHENVIRTLQSCKPFDVPSACGALLLDKRWQANCVRLEALVHLAVLECRGKSQITATQLARCFNELGNGTCGRMEDPAEDVFVAQVLTPYGSLRVLEGIWEGGVFYLQQFVDLVIGMPTEGEWSELCDAVFSMLKLSDAVCERAGLVPNEVGNPNPVEKLKPSDVSVEQPPLVVFRNDDLQTLGISRAALDRFVLRDETPDRLATTPLLNSQLQRSPILADGERIALVVPTAVSYAIRVAVVEFLVARRMKTSLVSNLSELYSRLIHKTQILGELDDVPLEFFPHNGLAAGEALCETESGVFVHLLCFMDSLDGIAETGLAGQNTVPDEHADWLAERIQKTREYASTHPNFRFGLTLLVQCGIGRGITMAMPRTKTEAWRTVPISVRDLITLSLVKNFGPLRLWKILEGEERLAQLGIMLQNHNGLLNLIAWVIDNEWHLAPHAKIPKDFRKSRGLLYIAPDFVLGLRQRVAIETDFLVAPRIDGSPAIVRRIGGSEFPEDHLIPTYAEEHYSEATGIPLLVPSRARFWWCHAVPTSLQEMNYEHWQLMRVWLPRIVSVIEPRLDQVLPKVVLLRVQFELDDSNEDHPIPSHQSIEQSIRAETDRDHGVVSLTIGVDFQYAQASPINIAERAIVRAICRGFATLSQTNWDRQTLDQLEAAIVPNDDARHMHRFYVKCYRDVVANDLSGRVVYLDELDVAGLQLGLAFRVESRLKGRALIRSKARCTEFLNALVRELENDLRQELRRFGRADFVKAALLNHERAQYQRRRWNRTARANLAFHGGTQEAMNVIATQEGELSGVILMSLLLVEVAICECPLTAIEKPESSDIAKLMALVHAIVITSGWSDAIHMDAMPPLIVIRPTGAVHVDTTFHNSVVMPFTELASASRIEGAMKSYDKNFQPLELIAADTPTSDSPTTDTKFEQAWKCEFGFCSEDLIKFVEAIEDIGARRQSAVFEIRKSQLIEFVRQEVEITTAAIIIDVLTLFPRDGWRTLPPDIEAELQRSPAKAPTILRPFEKDIQLGRFRRQFSVTRRPLVALQATDDPVMVIVPGHLRDGVRYIVDNYFDGSFPTSQIKSPEMRSWFGQRSNIHGLKFAQEVADEIRSLGWTTDRINWEVQAILGRGSDPVFGDLGRYGDVDVLAWNQSEKRILVIECKQLHYHKTPGEIAEQLSDFRGKMKRDGKSRDDLLKHLDRMTVLKTNSQKLCKRVGLPSDATIEGWIIFKNPVPMLYSWKQFESRIRIATFDDLPKVCRCGAS